MWKYHAVLRAMLPVVQVTVLAVRVTVCATGAKPALLARWMRKPVSLVELSDQVSVHWALLVVPTLTHATATLLGAAGAEKATTVVFEAADAPGALTATT